MLDRLLQGVKTVAIGGHERPDGDCAGSCTGLYRYICDNYKNIDVDVYLQPVPESFKIVEDMKYHKHEICADKKYDLFISLDCGDAQRLGFSLPLFQNAAHTFCVDHHISNIGFADENVIDADASSTCELVFDLMDKEKISKPIAEALYLGIVHDTGVFQYSCASPKTFRAAAFLLEKGVDAPTMIDSTYYEKTFDQNRILGQALLKSKRLLNDRCISSVITLEEMKKFHVTDEDMEGIVSQLRVTKGVDTAIFLYEKTDGIFKASLRSKKIVDVSKVAVAFGGGGHVRAAGCTLEGNPDEIVDNLLVEIKKQLNG